MEVADRLPLTIGCERALLRPRRQRRSPSFARHETGHRGRRPHLAGAGSGSDVPWYPNGTYSSPVRRQRRRHHRSPPISDDDFEETMYQLPREEVEKFIGDVKGLFGAMVNTVLLKKTLSILDNVVETMEKKPNTYPAADVDGIKLGRALLEKGYDLFSKYDEPTKLAIVEFIFKNEMWYIDSIYKKKEEK